MNVFVINAGSSSLKFKLFEMPSERLICTGLVERIGDKLQQLTYQSDRGEVKEETQLNNHRGALQRVVELLMDDQVGVISVKEEIEIVGHRVVHGGGKFSEPVDIDDYVKQEIRQFASLAPLHNPPNLVGIEVAGEVFPSSRHVAVFDTGFHGTIPEVARRYAVPDFMYRDLGIQVYGFHGISHQYVSRQAIEYLNNPHAKIITMHLGNGCSMTAVHQGRSMDHSMGFSPSNGLIMGSRSGDIDQGAIFQMIREHGFDADEVNNLLTRKSGMLGLTGFLDLRDIESLAAQGDVACKVALEMNAYRIRKYIGSYTAAMNGLDALVFTAGIGENSELIRQMVCENLDFLGIVLDRDKNKKVNGEISVISSDHSKVEILVIPTNEELEIARQVYSFPV